MDRAHRADLENRVICLLIIFTPKATVNKISKMVHILYALLMTAKN